MQALFLVLNKIECLETLLLELVEAGVRGGTIIESTGMARALGDHEDLNIIGTLRMLLDPKRQESKTLFFVLPEEKIPVARAVINRVVGGLDHPDTGILFALPIAFVDGLGE